VGGREPQGKPLLVLRTIDVNELVVEDAPSRVRVEPRGDAPLFRDDIGRKDFVTDPDPRSRPRTEAKGVVFGVGGRLRQHAAKPCEGERRVPRDRLVAVSVTRSATLPPS